MTEAGDALNYSVLFALTCPSRDLKKINGSSAHLAAKMILMPDRVEDSKDCCWGAVEDKEQD